MRSCPFFLQIGVKGNGWKECAAAAVIIDLAAVMGDAIGDNQIIDLENYVVAGDLIENLLRNIYIGGLVLDYHAGRKRRGIKHGVATARCGVELYADFVGKKSGRIAAVSDEVVDKMLAYPFFGSKGYVFLPQNIKHLFLAADVGNFKRRGWQV